MAARLPAPFTYWPEDAPEEMSPKQVQEMYERGFAGCWRDEASREKLEHQIRSSGISPDGSDVAHEFGLAETGKDQLVIPFVYVVDAYPGCWPGPAQGRGDCFVAGTMVLGEKIKPIEHVKIGDKVWTGKGNLTTVISTRAIQSAHPLIKITPIGALPITCTFDHKILVYRMAHVAGKRVNSARYKSVKDAKKQRAGSVRSQVVEVYESRFPVWIKAGDLMDNDFLLTPTKFNQISVPGSPCGLTKDDSGLWLLGYFLGDGHASGHSIEFMVSDNVSSGKVETALLMHGLRVSKTNQSGAARIRVSSTELVSWLRSQFYDDNKIKSFPGWAIGLKSFIDGLHAADGFDRDNAHYIDSTSESIIYGAYSSLVSLGYEPCISRSVQSYGCYANAKPIYRIIWRQRKQRQIVWRDESFVCRPIRKLDLIEGPTTVYDIGVIDRHHSFIANGHAVSNCVSHDQKNCILGSMVGDVITATPDEITGFVESLPEISIECILQGALGTEPIYWYRRHGGDGWNCDEAALVTQNESGVWIRKDYPELGFDLSKYSASLAGKYGRTLPPSEIAAEGRKHLIRTTTFMKSFEECRDFLKNLYFLSSCGGEGYSSKRDENGVSRRSGAWAHAMFGAGADDRPETKQIYGEGLILDGNSWGPDWNSGPRDIRDSAKYVPAEKKQRWIEIDLVNPSTGNIMIPKGFFWVRWSEWKRRQIIAKSSVNGFPRRKPNHLFI